MSLVGERVVGGELPVAARAAAERVLVRVQEWLAGSDAESERLVVVTRGAVQAGPGEGVVDLVHAPVWGLVRSVQTENPGRVVLMDLDEGTDVDGGVVASVVASGEPQVAVRGGRVLVPRLVRAESGPVAVEGAGDWGRGTVLITGATGALGAVLARHLVAERGARRLLLLSRRGEEAPGAVELREGLTALGADVRIVACDVSDRGDLAAVLGGVPGEYPVRHVVHTAGVLRDGLAADLSVERLHEVLRPKVDAAWNLHELLGEGELEHFVLYASLAGLLGTAGQANYAAANTFLDALAAHRVARGLVGVSLDWGLWSEASSLTGHLEAADLRRLARTGLAPLSTGVALELFDRVPAAGYAHLALSPVDVTPRESQPPLLLRKLIRGVRRTAAAGGGGVGGVSLAERLAAQSPQERERTLLALVRGQVASVLGHSDPDVIEADRSFQEIGFDSLTAVELRNQLNTATGLRLPTTLVFDHPNPAALAAYVRGELAVDDVPPAEALLSELAGIKSAIADAVTEADGDAYDRITAQLQELLTAAQTARGENGAKNGDADLSSASDEELFALLDDIE